MISYEFWLHRSSPHGREAQAGRSLIGFPFVRHPCEAILEMETQDPDVGPMASRHVSLPAALQVHTDDGSDSIFSSHRVQAIWRRASMQDYLGAQGYRHPWGSQNTALRLKRMLCVCVPARVSLHVPYLWVACCLRFD